MNSNHLNMGYCDMQEWIDAYLMGEMKVEEVQIFETLMANDATFRQEVELQAQIIIGVVSYNETQAANNPVSSQVSFFNFKTSWLRAAAFVAILLTTAFLLQTNLQYEGDKYAETSHTSQKLPFYGDIDDETLLKIELYKKSIKSPSFFSGYGIRPFHVI